MSKEAIMFCLDVGASMRPHLAQAIEGMKLLIESKILQTKQNEIGVVLFGANKTNNALYNAGMGGYENVDLFANLDRPRVSLSSRLDEIEVGEGAADLIDGLVVSVDVIFKKIGTKKFLKTIYLITAAENEIESPDDLQATVGHMIDQEINLVVIGINFKHTTASFSSVDVKQETSNTEEEEETVKSGNEKMLLSIVQSTKRGAVLRGDDLVKLLSELQTKTVRPTRNKCIMILPTPSIVSTNGGSSSSSGDNGDGIEILVFSRAKRTAAASLKKEAKNAYDPSDPKSGAVKTERTYRNPLKPDSEVPPEDLGKGYKYGRDIVPVAAADIACMKVESDRASLTIMGFSSAANISASKSIGDTKCVIPADNSLKSETAIQALALSLFTNNKVMIGRFVARKNADPQLVALMADPETIALKTMQQRLLMWQLPFSDDQRGFTFPSFDQAPKSQQPSEEQLACMSKLVSSYAINEDLFRPELTFNPLQQRLRKAIIQRVNDPDAPLPGIDPRVSAYMEPDQAMIKNALPCLNEFKQMFKFVTVEGSGAKKRKHFWSDITEEDGKGEEGDDTNAATSSTTHKDGSHGDDLSGKKVKTEAVVIGSINPIQDFESLMKQPSLISEAFQVFMTRIESIIVDGSTSAYYDKAVKCIIAMKKQALLNGESEVFNKFMTDSMKLKFGPSSGSMHGEVWDLLVSENVTLITSAEDSAVLGVSQNDAEKFLKEDDNDKQPKAVEVVVKAEESEDDMFDDMD